MRLEIESEHGFSDGKCPYCKTPLSVESTYEENDAEINGTTDCPECDKRIEVSTRVTHIIHKPGEEI